MSLAAHENPFRTSRVLCVRYRIDATALSALLAQFDALGRRGALVGPRGSGKMRAKQGILVTAHRPCALPTLYEHRTSAALLASIVSDLLRDEPTANPPLDRAQIDALFVRHHGNVRSALRELYDVWAG